MVVVGVVIIMLMGVVVLVVEIGRAWRTGVGRRRQDRGDFRGGDGDGFLD